MENDQKLFYTLFAGLGFFFLFTLNRLIHRLIVALDENLIVAAIAAFVIVILALFFLGLCLSWWLVRLAKKNHLFLKRLTEIAPWIFSFLSIDSRDNLERVLVEKADAQAALVDEELLAAIRKPKSRGRTSNFPYETRRRTVLAWENRGPNFSYTLAEFLDERFGSSSSGMPNVPVETFYYWRKKILAENEKG